MNDEEISAMDCWHYIAPLIPVQSGTYSIDIYVKTFRAFQLLEKEEKEKKKHDT